MAEEASARRWITCTGLGCAGLILIALVTFGGFLGSAWLGVRNAEPVERRLLPSFPAVVDSAQPGAAVGRVELDLSGAEVQVHAAAPGESLRVEAKFDEQLYELEETFDDASVPWLYQLSLSGDIGPLKTLLRSIVGGEGARVDIFLPVDVPLELLAKGEQAAFTIDLARMWLTSAEFDFAQGGVFIEASEVTSLPIESISLKGSMGAFRLVQMGNASPRRLLVDTKMSGLHVDLLGEWQNDSSITLRSNQGGAQLKLASNVTVVGIDTGELEPPREEELARPTLTFTVAADEIELVD